jgi:hypothetical protein
MATNAERQRVYRQRHAARAFDPTEERDAYATAQLDQLRRLIGDKAFQAVHETLYSFVLSDDPAIAQHAEAYFARGIGSAWMARVIELEERDRS